MKKYLATLFVNLVAAAAFAAGGSTLTFVGVACSGSWHTDLYLTGDASGAPGPQTVTLTYLPFGDGQEATSTTVTVSGGQSPWYGTAYDVVCDEFPGSTNTSGVLIVDTPFPAWGWVRTWSPPGYGQQLEDAQVLQYTELYATPHFDQSSFRCNLLLYNPDSTYAILTLGNDYVFIEPYQAIILQKLAPGETFMLVSGGRVRATLSLVCNATNDPVTVRLVPVPGG